MVVEGVITRMVPGGVLVDIQLESGEPAFVPLSEIPAKAMPKVRDLLASRALQPVRIVQLDRSTGSATASLRGLLEPPPDPEREKRERRPRGRAAIPPPEPPRPPKVVPRSAPAVTSASERARRQQAEILRRLRGES